MPQTSVALDRADNLCALHHPVPISQRFIKSTLPKVELFHLDFLFSQGERGRYRLPHWRCAHQLIAMLYSIVTVRIPAALMLGSKSRSPTMPRRRQAWGVAMACINSPESSRLALCDTSPKVNMPTNRFWSLMTGRRRIFLSSIRWIASSTV